MPSLLSYKNNILKNRSPELTLETELFFFDLENCCICFFQTYEVFCDGFNEIQIRTCVCLKLYKIDIVYIFGLITDDWLP